MVTSTSQASQVSFLGQYAQASDATKSAVISQVERLRRRNAKRRYERRVESVNNYLERVTPRTNS